jgi:ABC-type branched-subunit amino acid transport system substrate-binding protein
MPASKRRLGVAVLLVLALAATACGSSSKKSSSSSGSTETTAAAAKPTGTPIKLGVITSLTGPSVHFTEVPVGAQAGADAINAAGGVKDPAGGAAHPIEIVACDDAFDPNTAAACGRKMVSEKVLALIGNVSPHGDIYGPLVYAAGIPVVGISANSAAESINELSFPISGGSVVSLLSNVAFLAKQGVKKMTVEHIQNAAADFLVSAMKKKAADLGVTVVNDVLVPADATDMTSYAARFTSNGADGAVLVEPSDRISKFINALGQAGVSLEKFKMAGQLNPADLKKLGSAANGFYGSDTSFPVDYTANPGIKKFAKEYSAEKNAPEPSTFALQAWVDVHVIAETLIPKMSTIDSATLVSTMKTIGPISRPEWTPWDWSQVVEAIPGLKLRAFSLKMLYSKAENGKFTPVTSDFTQYL